LWWFYYHFDVWVYFWFLVSNEVPEHPVVSPVSGSIYERRLIEKYIAENGTDPMNGEKLNASELVDIKSKILFPMLESNFVSVWFAAALQLFLCTFAY